MNRFLMLSAFLISTPMNSGPVLAEESDVVFGCNYAVSVSIDEQQFSVAHQDRVRSGSAIAFNLQDFLFQLHITESESETAIVELVLSEKAEDGWHQVYTTPPSFTVDLGLPSDYRHSDDIATFEVSLIVSKIVP